MNEQTRKEILNAINEIQKLKIFWVRQGYNGYEVVTENLCDQFNLTFDKDELKGGFEDLDELQSAADVFAQVDWIRENVARGEWRPAVANSTECEFWSLDEEKAWNKAEELNEEND